VTDATIIDANPDPEPDPEKTSKQYKWKPPPLLGVSDLVLYEIRIINGQAFYPASVLALCEAVSKEIVVDSKQCYEDSARIDGHSGGLPYVVRISRKEIDKKTRILQVSAWRKVGQGRDVTYVDDAVTRKIVDVIDETYKHFYF
jgi:hypothetical protein